MKSFNINSTVKVRLTKVGEELLEKNWKDFWNSIGRLNPYQPPTPDADGYVEFQMWDLMGNLGEQCGWGGDLPFDTEILIEDKDLKGGVEIEENKLLKECRQTGRTTATTEKVLKTVFSQMKETDTSKVLIEGDTATINGIKYKRVEEPKPPTLFDIILSLGHSYDRCYEIVDAVKECLPDENYSDVGGAYERGWNDAITTIKDGLG
jgi:hypothetical protein